MKPAVVLLAGGEGRRIGGGKPLILLGGRTLLDRALEQAQGWSDSVAIAVRDPAQAGEASAHLLLDDPAIEGPLSGLASALRFAERERRPAVLTLPCDMPFLPPDLPDRLAEAKAPAAVAAAGGRLYPVCALWGTETGALLPSYLASGRLSLVGFAEAAGCTTVEWPVEHFFNVNSPEDLAEAEKRL